MNIKEIMARDLHFVQKDDSVKQAATLMREFDVGALPVVDGERPLGMITDRDIAIRVVAEGKDPNKAKISDAMTRDTISCFEDSDVNEVANMMAQKQVRRIIVKSRNDDRIVGIVSFADIASNLNKDESGDVIRRISKPS